MIIIIIIIIVGPIEDLILRDVTRSIKKEQCSNIPAHLNQNDIGSLPDPNAA